MTDLGLELWSLSRHVRLSAEIPSEERGGVFPVSLGRHVAVRRTEALHEAPAPIRSPLRLLMKITGRQRPSSAAVAKACEVIVEWAIEKGFPMTAITFAEAAAAHTRDPYFTFVAGRTNRLVGENWRAEAFYTRAIRRAFRKQNWDVYVRAHLGAARMNSDLGRLRLAAEHLFSAARVALDQGHDWLAAQTYHDLFPLYYQLGDKTRAYLTAQKAVETYPHHHERFPVAVHDFLLLLILDGHFTEVWPMLERLTAAPLRSHDQVLVWGTVARASGNLGYAAKYSEAEGTVLQLAPHYDSSAGAAFLGLASGAHALDDLSLARAYANKAAKIATKKGDREIQTLALALVESIKRGERPPPPAPALRGAQAEALAALTKTVETELGSWRSDSTWTAKEHQSGLWTLGPV